MKKSVSEVVDTLQRNLPNIQNIIVVFETDNGPCVVLSHMSLGSACFMSKMVDRAIDSILSDKMDFTTDIGTKDKLPQRAQDNDCN